MKLLDLVASRKVKSKLLRKKMYLLFNFDQKVLYFPSRFCSVIFIQGLVGLLFVIVTVLLFCVCVCVCVCVCCLSVCLSVCPKPTCRLLQLWTRNLRMVWHMTPTGGGGVILAGGGGGGSYPMRTLWHICPYDITNPMLWIQFHYLTSTLN